MTQMGRSLDRGMVLVMSIWDDHESSMLWLDSDFPLTLDRSLPGVQRGPCSRDSGKPADVESKYPNSSVKYMNVKTGPINLTFKAANG
jgi:cellulose 1,4-beta-cellobiosidase